MNSSGFSDSGSGGEAFCEKDLAALSAALGMSYEIEYNVPRTRSENRSYHVQASVKMKGERSKRYAVFITRTPYTYGNHTKRITLEIAMLYRKPFDCEDSLLPKDVRRVRDSVSDAAVKAVLGGCVIKASKTRHIEVPRSSCVEELALKMAVANA